MTTLAAPRHPREAALEEARTGAATARDNAAGATTVPALRAEVERLAGLVETIVTHLEQESRP